MSKEQRFMKIGILEEKKRKLDTVISGLKVRVGAISMAIMPEMDIEDQNFQQAKTLLDECIFLKQQYTTLTGEIKGLEEDLGVSEE